MNFLSKQFKLYKAVCSQALGASESWHKTHFPCNHIFAVFDKWSFNSLLHSYKNSIFITSDTRQFDQVDPDEEPTSETSSMNRGNGDYSQVCGAETTVSLYLLVKMMHLLNPVALLPSQKSTTTSNLS